MIIVCAECGRLSDELARDWRAYLTADDEDGEEVVVFCPSCAAREFGNRSGPSSRSEMSGV